LSYLANTQTDKQTNKVCQKHYLLGGGKDNAALQTICSSYPVKLIKK